MRYVSADHSRCQRLLGQHSDVHIPAGQPACRGIRLAGRWLVGAASVPLLFPIAISDCLFQGLSSCAGQVFQTFEKMKFSAALTLLNSISRCILAVGMLLVLGRASALQWAFGSLAVSFCSACLAFAIVTRFFGLPSFSPSLFIRHSGEGFVYAISGSTTMVYNDIDKVVLSHFGMNRANGIYSMAYRLVNIGTMPISALVGAAFPRFFREGAKGIAATVPMARALLDRTAVVGIGVSATHVPLRSDHSTSGRQVLCGVCQRGTMAMPDSFFPLLSPQCWRRPRGSRTSEVSPDLPINRGNWKPPTQLVSDAAVFVARRCLGVPGNRRVPRRDELAGADLSQQAFGALAADNSELAVITILMFDPF